LYPIFALKLIETNLKFILSLQGRGKTKGILNKV
jgi:hypothetical protein